MLSVTSLLSGQPPLMYAPDFASGLSTLSRCMTGIRQLGWLACTVTAAWVVDVGSVDTSGIRHALHGILLDA